MKLGDKLKRYAITFDNWASPIFINALNEINAVKRAYYLFPNCDCSCGEKTTIKKIERI